MWKNDVKTMPVEAFRFVREISCCRSLVSPLLIRIQLSILMTFILTIPGRSRRSQGVLPSPVIPLRTAGLTGFVIIDYMEMNNSAFHFFGFDFA